MDPRSSKRTPRVIREVTRTDPAQDEITPNQAAAIIGNKPTTIRSWLRNGYIPIRRQGLRNEFLVRLHDLREFCLRLGYPFDERIAAQVLAERAQASAQTNRENGNSR